MKPGLTMEKPSVITLPATIVQNTEKPVRSGWSTPKKITVGVILGLVTLVVVAVVVIVSVYFGIKLSQENFKTVRQTFVTDNGEVTEDTTVSKDAVDVKIADAVETVYDYKYGLVVERYTNQDTKARSACYARYMNMSQAPSRDAGDYSGDGEVALTKQNGSNGENTERWVSTDRKVPRYMISQAVDAMCRDTEIYWMEISDSQDAEERKRATVYLYTVFNSCYTTNYPCLYYCKVTHVYYNTSIRLYISVTKWEYYCHKSCAAWYSYC